MSAPDSKSFRGNLVLMVALVLGLSWAGATLRPDGWSLALMAADGPKAPPVSTPPVSQFAPAELLAAEVDLLRAAAERDLADEEAFRKVGDLRNGDAAAMATLLLVLGLHDRETKYRDLAAQAVPLAVEMANTHKYAVAKDAWQRLDKVLKTPPDKLGKGKRLEWSAPATGEPLLYFVESRYSQLEQDLAEDKFRDRADRSVRAAAVLAALGAAMAHETEYTTSAEKLAVWQKQSVEWRESAGKLTLAIRGGDRPAAEMQFERLGKSCTTCHETFQVDQ